VLTRTIRNATATDAPAVCAIYNPYVIDTVISFEEEPVPETIMADRLTRTLQHYPWLICEVDGVAAGFAYAGTWKTRSAYRYTAETTIYFLPDHVGRGHGKALYLALLERLREQGIHTVVGCIALPNPASIALHEACGYRQVAHFREAGLKFGNWVDVGYWQRPL
jgi:L-amino acid N-acyltransferase YncA